MGTSENKVICDIVTAKVWDKSIFPTVTKSCPTIQGCN